MNAHSKPWLRPLAENRPNYVLVWQNDKCGAWRASKYCHTWSSIAIVMISDGVSARGFVSGALTSPPPSAGVPPGLMTLSLNVPAREVSSAVPQHSPSPWRACPSPTNNSAPYHANETIVAPEPTDQHFRQRRLRTTNAPGTSEACIEYLYRYRRAKAAKYLL